MQMFEVKTFEVCRQTGITSFEIQWDFGRGPKTDRGSFTDQRDAREYITSSKRSFILIMFADYVKHIRTLLETGHHDFYKKEEKLLALERCAKYTQWLDDKTLPEICKVILALQEDMRKILPVAANSSFMTCESKILDMVVFCKKESGNIPVSASTPIPQTTT
jgi:hypothetical protein